MPLSFSFDFCFVLFLYMPSTAKDTYLEWPPSIKCRQVDYDNLRLAGEKIHLPERMKKLPHHCRLFLFCFCFLFCLLFVSVVVRFQWPPPPIAPSLAPISIDINIRQNWCFRYLLIVSTCNNFEAVFTKQFCFIF